MFTYISNLDNSILHNIQSIGSVWRPVAMFLSYGLGYEVMIVVFVIALFLMRKHRIAFEIIAIAIASLAVTFILKLLFHMPRPYVIDHSVIQYDTDGGWGMPSAHALMSVVVLGWIALRHPRSHVLLWGSIILIVLIGLSRVYLGVHYPSQVILGWIVGSILLYVFHLVDQRMWSPFKKKFK